MPIRELDIARIVADPTYAATLTTAEWESLSDNHEWAHFVEEYADVVAQTHAAVGYTVAQTAAPAPNLGAQQTSFQFVGTKQPRVHGLGIVSNVGWYTQNLNRGNQLFMAARA